jgi:restriction endonuclease S subunit
MSALPRGWASASFNSLGRLYCGQSPSSSTVNAAGNGTPYVTGPEQWDGERLHLSKWTTDPRRLVPDGCVFITVKGAGVGKLFPGVACAIGRDVYAFLPHRELDARFIFLALTRNILSIKRAARGDIPGLSKADILDHTVEFPPPGEQRRIADKFDKLSIRARRARDQLDHVPRLVEKYKQAILAAALRGELTREWRSKQVEVESAQRLIEKTEEPSQSRGGREATTDVKPGVAGLSVNDPGSEPPTGWAWVSLRRIARQETGHTPSRNHPEYWDGGIPWIGIPDAGNHHGHVIQETLQTVSELGLENSSARLLPAGTVCLSRTASVGYVTIMGRLMATSQDFATWTCTSALVPKYLMFALMAEGEDIRSFGEGSTHTTIYFPEIRALHICLAPLPEQHEIVARVERAIAWIDRLANEAGNARKLIDHLDHAILAKAFQGELVPQDPTDEPASVRLERIRVERAAAPAQHRRENGGRAASVPVTKLKWRGRKRR